MGLLYRLLFLGLRVHIFSAVPLEASVRGYSTFSQVLYPTMDMRYWDLLRTAARENLEEELHWPSRH